MMNWNSEPYNDDFDEKNKFLKILFRPGKAVQTRELNQLQTILQNQISRHGNHIFKQGAMIIPGQMSIDKEISFVRLKDTNVNGKSVNSIVDSLIDKVIVGTTSNILAEVIFSTKRTSQESATLFVRYKNSGSSNQKSFIENEVLRLIDDQDNPNIDLSVSCESASDIINGVLTPVFGKGCIASIKQGVYYVNGFFVLVEDQTIVLDKYTNSSTYRVGLKVVENIIKPEDDSSLLDNAQGTPNFTAPGAHRYQIDLILEKRQLTSLDDANFIELVRVDSGISTKEIRSTEYSVLEHTLARRTYDESGDYIVRDFNIDVREDRNNNRGIWLADSDYLIGDIVTNTIDGVTYNYVCRTTGKSIVAPTHVSGYAQSVVDGIVWGVEEFPSYNRGVSLNGDETMLSIGVEPGKAYVQGYEIEKISTEFVKLPKARSFKTLSNASVTATVGNYVLVSNIVGVPDILSSPIVNIKQGQSVIATCRIRGLEKHDSVRYKLFIFDVNLTNPSNILETATSLSNESFSCSISQGDTFRIHEPQNSSLVYPLPYYAIKNVDQSRTLYSITQVRSAQVNGNLAVIQVDGNGEFVSEADEENYIVFNSTGEILDQYTLNRSTSKTTLFVSDIPDGVESIVVFATVRKSSIDRKSKVLLSTIETFETPILARVRTLNLSKSDGYKLLSVKMEPRGFNVQEKSYTIDITERYTFNDGQTDTHYGLCDLSLKGSYDLPTGPIQVEYEYFDHVGLGDYFTVDSYQGQVDYKEIPLYNDIPLRDCFDFRPRINVDGTSFSQYFLPKRGVDITCDFQYYLGRKSKLCLDNTGKFSIVDGESSLFPGEPSSPKLSMVLYDFELEPYTFGTLEQNVKIDKVDNRRYTMRDIGKLEKRIDNLEYYTTLSLLEQETNLSSVIDSDGIDRFKNGFIVDSFTGHSVGDTTNPDYLCSIDMENGMLRPFFSMNNMNLVEKANTNTERLVSGYNLHKDIVTLPIVDNVVLIDQPYASRTENVNPFAVFTFLGNVKLTPFSDEWFETERAPDVVNNIEGNFNTLRTLAEEIGVFGTVWNSWQNMWTGTASVSIRNESKKSFRGRRNLTIETVATNVGQSRSGIKTSLVANVDRQIVEDRVISTAVIPYIRSRNILIQVKGLKPSTTFYPFFDGVDVSSFCTPSTLIEYVQLTSLDFDASTNAGASAKEIARQIEGDSQICLNCGDVIKSGGVTGVVIGKHQHDGKKYLHVANIKGGSFVAGNTITAIDSISKATASVIQVTNDSQLKTTETGDLNLLFKVPNTESIRFRVGSREFKLIDSETNSNEFTSKGVAIYQASGILETKQATFNAIRNAEIVQESISENRTIVTTSERTISDTGWYDPLAQTFLVQNKGGAFLTKIDIFFSNKDDSVPITLEIREVVNGYPGKKILPFSKVTLPAEDVKISNKQVTVDGVFVNSFDTPTTFKFESPVYVNDNQEYCLVLLSDSNKYKVWISQLGDGIPDSDRTISEQPYAGVLFKSQNASTWTANQYQDLKFTMYRAKFDITRMSDVVFVNDVIPRQVLEKDPLQFKIGSSYIRVFQKDHGFKPGDSVTLSGIVADSSGDKLNGIPVSYLNKTHVIPYGNVNSVQLDSYIIPLSSDAIVTSSGYFGGSNIKATRNYMFNNVQPIVGLQTLPDTSALFGMRVSRYSDGVLEQPIPVLANENNVILDNTKVVRSDISSPSCEFVCKLYSNNDAISPVIDTQRTSLILVSNKINNSTRENTDFGGFDTIEDSFYVSDVESSGSTTYSNYVTRRIRLLNPCTLFKIRFAANIPTLSNVELYYRVTNSSSSININTLNWTLLDSEIPITKVENGNDTFYDITYMNENISSFDSIQIKIAMKSTSASAIPKIKDLRVIACA